jgi:hypothetical protein
MPKRTFKMLDGEPLLDVVSYGRGGPTGTTLTPAQVEQIRRTVRRTPEVMVKILPRASNDLKAVGKHLDYIGRKGELELETDDGERLNGQLGEDLLDSWDLDLDDVRRQGDLAATKGRHPPKLVHKLMISMPPGTPPDKVLGAVRTFAREELWGQHRYAFVLHTDEPHPHVHLVLKAVNEDGLRLNIKKATLRHWRSEFARNLRLLGVEANATERAVRGESRKAKNDVIYRASLRGDSTYARERSDTVAAEQLKAKTYPEADKRMLVETRMKVEGGWRTLAHRLAREGHQGLARDVHLFVEGMPPPRPEKELIVEKLMERHPVRARAPEVVR